MSHKYGFDAATDFLHDAGESMSRGGNLKVKATDLADSAPQINGQSTSKSGRINLKKVAEVLADYGLDPTVEIVNVLPELDVELRAKVMLELIQYCQPKLKSVEVNATVTELPAAERERRLNYLMGKVTGGTE